MSDPRIYFDMGPWIEGVRSSVDLPAEKGLTDAAAIKVLLERHEAGKLEIKTSIISIAQVLRAEHQMKSVNPGRNPATSVKDAIHDLLSSGKYCDLEQATHTVMTRARNLQWSAPFKLKPEDAIHLASALELGCEEFITFDHKDFIDRAEDYAKMNVPIRMIRPSDSDYLTSESEEQAKEFGQGQLPFNPRRRRRLDLSGDHAEEEKNEEE